MLRFLAFVGMILLPGLVPLVGQSYQSSFSEVKFDRAKGPATFHGGVKIDVASGGASMEIPCGPGIGARGLHFSPTLSMRLAPQYNVATHTEELVNLDGSTTVSTVDLVNHRSFGSASFVPGTLDMPLFPANQGNYFSYSFPDGGGRPLGSLPPQMDETAANALLARFGVSGSVAPKKGYASETRDPMVVAGSSGQVIIGLRQAGSNYHGTDEVEDCLSRHLRAIDPLPMLSMVGEWPRRVLVVQGEVAYEYTYVSHYYELVSRPGTANPERNQLSKAHFLLTAIHNRFGEHLGIAYEGDGLGYTVTWSTNPGVQIQVRLVAGTSLTSSMPKLLYDYNNAAIGALTQVRVSYLGITPSVSSYLLDLGNPDSGALNLEIGGQPGSDVASAVYGQDLVSSGWGSASLSLQPVKVTLEDTGETIQFVYSRDNVPTLDYANYSGGAPAVLSQVIYPNRSIALTWGLYRYRPSHSPSVWGEDPGQLAPLRPDWAYGVVSVADMDMGSGQTRMTGYSRVTPTLNWVTSPDQLTSAAESWISRDFYTAVTYPDGQVSLHRFVEPAADVNAFSGDDGFRNLAFLKHVEREVRYYASGVSWSADLTATSPASSTAYKWVVKDRLDLRTACSPDGDFSKFAVPYPTRTRSWDKESRTFVSEESTDWDNSTLGWTVTHHSRGFLAANSDMSFSLRGLAYTSSSYAPTPLAYAVEEQSNRTLDPKITEWLLNRVSSETHRRTVDSTGYGVVTGGKPSQATVQDPVFNTVLSTTVGGGSEFVTTTMNYQNEGATSPSLLSVELKNAYLSGPWALSGNVGVSAYGYDTNGFLDSISTMPNATTTLNAGQDQDAIGRPIAQYDANGRKTQYLWDSSNRLTDIVPPAGVSPTAINYHSDFRGVTVTRGGQVQEFRYNGFGELVLERRKAPDALWSHKIHGYDSAGRKTGETVWITGRGDDHETLWANKNLTQATSTTTASTVKCLRWATDADGEAYCKTWGSVPGTTTTVKALYAGSAVAYDARSRVVGVTDANGVVTQTAYGAWAKGPQKLITVAPGTAQARTTTFQSDAQGRLVKVLDALGQKTEYFYDASDRNVRVNQYDNASHTQTRTWTYNSLGWLTSVTQPESGTTTYSNFTVQGKPLITDYNGRSVSTSQDWMGRVTDVNASDGSVSQRFVFDTAPGGLGQLASSLDGNVQAAYSYEPATGRLVTLSTTLPVDGASQSFLQTYTYDTNGNRIGGNTSHGAWTQTFHNAAGLPKLLSYGSQIVAATPWTSYDPASWALNTIDFGNGAKSTFTYGTDQTRLASVKHGIASGSTTLAYWTYEYDSVGNLAKEVDQLKAGYFDQYSYDALNRLISAVIQSPTYGEQLQNFSYDTFGNRITGRTERVTAWSGTRGASTATVTSTSVPSVANTTFDPNNSALYLHNQVPAQMTNEAYTGALYDAQGNLTQIYQAPGASTKAVTMGYDALGRVTSVFFNATGVTEVYQYRADGLRTLIKDYLNGTFQKTHVQVYNDARQLVSQWEKTATGSLTWKRDILYMGTREAAEIDSLGMHVTQVDHLGSPRLVIGPSGAKESSQKYLPFGELLETGSGYKPSKGYTNHEQTDASGLIYMQARFYVPWAGRFASPDPGKDQHFEETQSWNIYSYVRNNPVMSTDPTGMQEGAATKVPDHPIYRDTQATNQANKILASQAGKPGVGERLVQGVDKEGAAKEVRDPANGSVSQAAYGKAHLGVTGAELSGGVAKTDQVGLAGPDGRLKFQAHGTEGSLALGLIPASTTKTTGPGKTEQQTALIPKLSAQISIFKAGFGLKLGNKVYSVGLTAGAGLKVAPGKFEVGALVYFSADAVK